MGSLPNFTSCVTNALSGTVSLFWAEFEGRGPVAPTAGGVFHAHSRAVGVAGLGEVVWDANRAGEGGHFRALPCGRDFVMAGRVGNGERVRGCDFGEAPL